MVTYSGRATTAPLTHDRYRPAHHAPFHWPPDAARQPGVFGRRRLDRIGDRFMEQSAPAVIFAEVDFETGRPGLRIRKSLSAPRGMMKLTLVISNAAKPG